MRLGQHVHFPRRVFNEVYVGEKTIYDGTKALDDALATGVRLMRRVPAICPPGKPENTYWRCDRKGELPKFETKPTLVAGHPDMLGHARYVASSLAKAYCSHPAFAGVLACTEMRDHVYPSFNTEHLRYKEETGHEVPSGASYKWFYFPLVREKYPDGVVPDDYPILSYYRWFWHGGDGWPRYASAIADGFRKYAGSYGDGSEKQKKHPFFSLFDPAVRCPPVWGSGAVYELSRGKAVKFTRDASGRVVVPVSFDTNDGRIFAFLREPIAGVSLSAKISPSGDAMDIAFSVKGKSGKLVQGRLPVEIRIFDASGRELDGAGWACAVDGVCSRSVPLNVDDPKGGYTIRARDIASGLKTVKSVEH